MVKKLVLDLGSIPQVNGECQELQHFNVILQDLVTKYKDKINEYYKNKSWDRYKKISNEYELIFTSPNTVSNISKYNPVSRSFFKLWEILHDFEDNILYGRPMKTVFLAEGPGGFTEAFLHKRKEHSDECYGITLKSNQNKNIPDWKLANMRHIKVCYGKDGTGNLYSLENIEHFCNTVGHSSVDFITADGGFDFSSDFNNQEDLSLKLILCEVLCALMLQGEGGSFLLKIYDCFHEQTLKMIHVLKRFYEHVHFIKPLTSRPANSERYLLCTGFHIENVGMWQETLQHMKCHIEGDTNMIFQNTPYEYSILYHIILYNYYYTMRQIYYIQRTINYINFFSKNNDDGEVMQALLQKHSQKSKKWCMKYSIPFRDIF